MLKFWTNKKKILTIREEKEIKVNYIESNEQYIYKKNRIVKVNLIEGIL